ncbi:MAG: ABC transporter ATP-binding protein [Alcanivoracaceae bacterium]|nr:ABC transporter ATP-binding protein [Alcanivoracaceae bacterium]
MAKEFSPFNPPANFWMKSWRGIVQLIVNGLLKSLIVISSYYWIKNLSFLVRQQQEILIENILFLLLAALFIIVLRLHERYIAEKMSQKYINSIRSSLLKRLMRASIREIQVKSVGNLSSRLAGDLSAVKRWLSLGISRLVTHSILLSITTVLIIKINITLGLIIGFTLLLLLLLAVFVGNQLKYTIRQVRRNRIKIHSLLVERLSVLPMIRTMGKERKEVQKINTNASKLENNIAKQGIFLGLLRGIGDASALVLISVFFLFNGYNGHYLSTDEITALISVILFLNAPIRELGRVQEYYQGAKLSIKKIQELYDIPRIVRGRSRQRKVTLNSELLGDIIIRNLGLNPVFDDLNLRARKGERIALTGKNGSGKSTLLQIILGLIKVDAGKIKVNGVYPNKTTPNDRARNIGYSSAEASLMKYSLRQNLCYRKPRASKEEINNLLAFCQLDQLVKILDRGINTQVNEHGQNFSSGEKARISLFRALLGKPAILILDEPESYLDKQGFKIIKKLLKTYDGTLIIATHNQELISLCKREWNLDRKKHKETKPMRLINNHVE